MNVKVVYNRFGMIQEHFIIFEKSAKKDPEKMLKLVNMKRMALGSSNLQTLYFELCLIQSRESAKHSPRMDDDDDDDDNDDDDDDDKDDDDDDDDEDDEEDDSGTFQNFRKIDRP